MSYQDLAIVTLGFSLQEGFVSPKKTQVFKERYHKPVAGTCTTFLHLLPFYKIVLD